MGGSGDEIPAQALSRFAAAEARLYPMALTDPVSYQLATTLVGLVADELRRSTVDVATVVDRRAELVDLVPRLAQEAGLDAAGIPAEAVVDAASALRCRELGGIGSGAFEGA
jgi:hypothetical protein